MESAKKPAKMTNVFAGFSVDTNFCKVKSMDDRVDVMFNGMIETIHAEVAKELGLHPYQEIDSPTLMRAMILNCEVQLAMGELDRAINEFNREEESKNR